MHICISFITILDGIDLIVFILKPENACPCAMNNILMNHVTLLVINFLFLFLQNRKRMNLAS